MKRSAPHRKTPLKRTTPLPKQRLTQRVAAALRRSGPWAADSTPKPADGRTARQSARPPARWTAARGHKCEACGRPTGRGLWGGHLHHVVERQHVAAEGGDEFDPRNAMTLCVGCHEGQTSKLRKLPLARVPGDALDFAVALLGRERAADYLRRHYAGDDPRIERLGQHNPGGTDAQE